MYTQQLRSKFLLLLLLFAGSAVAEDQIVLIPSIAFLEKKLDFYQKNGAGAGAGEIETEFSAWMPMLDVSLTAGYQKWYLTIKYDHTFTDVSTDTDEEPVITSSGNARYFWQPPGTDMQVEREDKNITIGYNVSGGLNIFAGYMDGETTITPPPTCQNPIIYTPFPPVTQIYCQAYNFAWLRLRDHNTNNPGQPLDDYVQTYTEEGPYIGFSYAWQPMELGTLSFSAAYAQMDGTFSDNIGVGGAGSFNAEGDVDGVSVGLTWSQPLSERTAYFIDVRRQEYDMDSKDEQSGIAFETSETMTGVTLGIQLYY